MPRSETPRVQISQLITIGLDHGAHALCHAPVRVHVEQDRTGIPDQAVRPASDDGGTDNARQRVHPEPAKRADEHQARDHKHGHCGIGHDVDNGGAHVVVAPSGVVGMLVLFENDVAAQGLYGN